MCHDTCTVSGGLIFSCSDNAFIWVRYHIISCLPIGVEIMFLTIVFRMWCILHSSVSVKSTVLEMYG